MRKFKTIVRRISYVLLMSFIYLTAIPKLANTENLVITTYYPAPYGGYVSLLTTNNTWLARDAGNVGIRTGGISPRGVLEVNMGGGSNNYFAVNADNNIGLELRSGSSGGTPYIDFSNNSWSDYNARLRLIGNGKMAFEGTSLNVSGRIGTQGYDADSGYPWGWGGGVHTWDVYAEGSIATGQGGGTNWGVNSAGYMWFSPNGRIDGLCRWQWKGPGWGSCNWGEVLVTINWTGFDYEYACIGNANFIQGIGNVCLFGYKSVPVSGNMLCCRIAWP